MSKMFTLNLRDLFKGSVVAVFSAVVGYAYLIIQADSFNFDWRKLILVVVSAFLGYLAKNFASDDKGAVLGVTVK